LRSMGSRFALEVRVQRAPAPIVLCGAHLCVHRDRRHCRVGDSELLRHARTDRSAVDRMNIEQYGTDHLEGVVRLSLRAWSPVFDSLKQVFAPAVYDTFYPTGWRVAQEKSVRDVCASADFTIWVAIESGTVAGFVALRYHAADKLGEIYM